MHTSNSRNLRIDQFAINRSRSTKDQKLTNNKLNFKSFKFKTVCNGSNQNLSNFCSIQTCRDNPFFSGIEAMPGMIY